MFHQVHFSLLQIPVAASQRTLIVCVCMKQKICFPASGTLVQWDPDSVRSSKQMSQTKELSLITVSSTGYSVGARPHSTASVLICFLLFIVHTAAQKAMDEMSLLITVIVNINISRW